MNILKIKVLQLFSFGSSWFKANSTIDGNRTFPNLSSLRCYRCNQFHHSNVINSINNPKPLHLHTFSRVVEPICSRLAKLCIEEFFVEKQQAFKINEALRQLCVEYVKFTQIQLVSYSVFSYMCIGRFRVSYILIYLYTYFPSQRAFRFHSTKAFANQNSNIRSGSVTD